MNPFVLGPVNTLFDEITNLTRDWGSSPIDPMANQWLKSTSAATKFNNIEDNDHYFVRVVAPGFQENELQISMRENRITISGKIEGSESSSSVKYNQLFSAQLTQFEKSFLLPQNVDAKKISAEYRCGILVVTLPKQNVVSQDAQQIKIAFEDQRSARN